MKGAVLLFDEADGLRRAARVVNGTLENLEIDILDDTSPRLGSIFRATVEMRLPALGAAFIDLDGSRGFLPESGTAQAGDTLLVQVRREAEGEKAARVSADLQIEGRFLVHTPDRPGINVSRKIADANERKRLAAALRSFEGAGGFVIRTASEGLSEAQLEREALLLTSRARFATDGGDTGCLVDGPTAFERLLMQATGDETLEASPGIQPDLPAAAATETPFDHYDVETQIDVLLSPRVALGDDAWMSIEPTAALIAIDVNTGGARGGDALLRVNLAAVDALPRQLLLRRLGGSIAVDFAGGPKGKARRHLEDRLQNTDLKPLGWGPAGWLELQRRKPGRSLAQILRRSSCT